MITSLEGTACLTPSLVVKSSSCPPSLGRPHKRLGWKTAAVSTINRLHHSLWVCGDKMAMGRKGQGRTEPRTGLHWGWGLLRTQVLVLSHHGGINSIPILVCPVSLTGQVGEDPGLPPALGLGSNPSTNPGEETFPCSFLPHDTFLQGLFNHSPSP